MTGSRERAALAFLAVAFATAPWAPVKLILLAIACGGLGWIASRGAHIGCLTVAFWAGAAVWAALVVSPYWLLAPTAVLRIAALALTGALVVVWLVVAATDLRWRARPQPLWPFVALVSVLAVLDFPGLVAPLEFRGDEDVHVARPLALLERVQALAGPHGLLAFLLLTVLIIGMAFRPRLGKAVVGLSLLVSPLGLAALFASRPPAHELLVKLGRYPVASAWLHSAAAFSPTHLLPPFREGIYQEALYRLVPAGAVFVLGCWLLRVLKGPPLDRLLGALVLTTVPVVVYCTTALYLELPAVTLLTIGLYGLEPAAVRWIRGRAEASGSVLALAGGLLLKESAIPMGIVAVVCCGLWVLRSGPGSRSSLGSRLAGWVRFAAAVLLPAGLYLGWRLAVPSVRASRDVTFDRSALGTPDLYEILARALGQQIGPALLLAAAGIWSGFRRRRPRRAGVWLLIAAGMLLFLAGDSVRLAEGVRLPAYWCSSRLLFIAFPPLCCLCIEGYRWLAPRFPVPIAVLAVSLLAWQLVTRPLGWDGSRPPSWGDYVAETSGERYPYDALFRWLSEAGASGEVRIVGRDYSYRDDFYLKKHHLGLTVVAPLARRSRSVDLHRSRARDEPLGELRAELTRQAAAAPAGAILVAHVPAADDPDALPPSVGRFHVARSFRLGQPALVVYLTATGPGGPGRRP